MQRASQSPLPRSSSKPPVATSPPSRSSGRAPRGDSRMAVTFVVDNDGGEDGMPRAKSSAAAPPSSASADTSCTENLEPDPHDMGCNSPPHSSALPSRPDCLLQPTPPLAAATTTILIASAFLPMSARLARVLCRCSNPAASHPHAASASIPSRKFRDWSSKTFLSRAGAGCPSAAEACNSKYGAICTQFWHGGVRSGAAGLLSSSCIRDVTPCS